MNTKLIAVVIVFVTNFRLCQGKKYDNYVMFRTIPMEKEHLNFLQKLESQKYIDMIFWKKPYKLFETVQVIVNPTDTDLFRDRCKHFGLVVKEMTKNVQELFDAQNVVRRYMKFRTNTYTWDVYHALEDIYQWLADVTKKYPKICELIPIGKSVQNRDIYALSIIRKKTKGTVIVEGGLHGNEWISTEVVTFLINHLLTPENSTDDRLYDVAYNYQWYLIPVANPDGYVYSQTNSSDRIQRWIAYWKNDRLWRKNRRSNLPNGTQGVDLNRNFDYKFCKFGSSNISSDDVYCGPKPFSEPETNAISQLISRCSKNLKYYFSFHAYGQKIIIPYGDKILHVGNYADSENYGKQALVKIYKKTGLKYNIGNSYDTLGHKISGDSASWVKDAFRVPFVYTFLLRDEGTYGYGMPPSEILPTCEETMTAVLEIMTTRVKRLRADLFSDIATCDGISHGLFLSFVIFWLAK